MPKLKDHPRLFIQREDLDQLSALRASPDISPFQSRLFNTLHDICEEALQHETVPYDASIHNPLLLRARKAQHMVWSLAVQFLISHDEALIEAVMNIVREMGAWEYWNSDAERLGIKGPQAGYDLSCGENCLTLALAYDLLYQHLQKEERKEIVDIALNWSIGPGRRSCSPGELRCNWFGNQHSNWNTVCSGGFGTLVLAMYEDIEDADTLLELVEESFTPYYDYLQSTDGGWPEGMGYWNYGMRYGYLFLLSWESAFEKAHPLLERPSSKKTLRFPPDFCPKGIASGFGDVNRWSPFPFHVRAAARYGDQQLLQYLYNCYEQSDLMSLENSQGTRPISAMLLCFNKDLEQRSDEASENASLSMYNKMGWAALHPKSQRGLYLSIRGGTTKAPHTHADLMSFTAVVDDESLIVNIPGPGYLDTTFSPRRFDLPELGSQYKNTSFVNGVSVRPNEDLDLTEVVQQGPYQGLRMIATKAMDNMRGEAMHFLGRLMLRLDDDHALIVDRCHQPSYGTFEARFNTYGSIEVLDQPENAAKTARIKGQKQELLLSFCSNLDNCVIATGTTLPTVPIDPQAQVLRYLTDRRSENDAILVSVLGPKTQNLRLEVHEKHLEIKFQLGERSLSLGLSKQLELLENV